MQTGLWRKGARVIPVIETKLERRGTGKEDNDPIRIITQYWSLDGELLAEVDHWLQEEKNKKILKKE